MNYFILTARNKNGGVIYYWAQNITRNVYETPKYDQTTFLCSGQLTAIDTADVVCITAHTPCGTIEIK